MKWVILEVEFGDGRNWKDDVFVKGGVDWDGC